ncbi:glycosyltransferase family 39 protein [Butyricicoccus faecihominis]|uniref:glycosyltransferase family 39 protein n=1 Tax=Butyricicoccus faecihominis TaxID=1712515 RepID=UPI00247A4390|nr:glycosyltransferase family 39 protein [Butyricicoccus faecihominis]MCQ5129945.1 glycosyltransferase family 39 protein [Butyricicoccus faecihominis]
MEKTEKTLRRLFLVLFTLAAASIILQNGAVLALAAAVGLFYACRKWEIPHFTLFLLGGGVLLRVCIVLLLRPPIESDFSALYAAASQAAAGDFSFQTQPYFSMWAYQSGFVAWQSLFLRLWNDPMCIKLVNCVLSAGTVVFLYRLALDRVRAEAARAAALLLTLFPGALLLPTVLTNQIASAFFLVLAAWLLTGRDCTRLGFWRYPLAGLALQCGNLLRPEGMILLVAVLAWAVFRLLTRNRAELTKQILCGMLALLAVYGAAHAAADAAIRESGLNRNGLHNGNPLWKVVTGLNPETDGAYSDSDWALLEGTMQEGAPTEETERLEKQLIYDRLTASPKTLIKLVYHKINRLWVGDGLVWMLGPFLTQPQLTWYQHPAAILTRQADRALFYLAFTLSLIGLLRRGRRSADELLPYFIVFAAFSALLLVEIQPRYAYLPQLFLFLAAAGGLDALMKGVKKHG